MSKVIKIVGAVASVAALIPGPHQVFAQAAVVLAGVAAPLTAKKPPARGSITSAIIAAEPPRPYLMGEVYSAGVIRHQVGYGPTTKGVPNPFWWEPVVYSSVGPVEQLVTPMFNFEAIGSYYNGFYAIDSQLGARPEATALIPPFGAATNWGANHKLSGCAAIGWNFKFDRDGKVFANGFPPHGAIWKGEKAYDPRLDSTRAGGVGPHRLGVESTYTYTDNPALHAGTYAYGRYQNGILIMGIGVKENGIDWQMVAMWANDCEVNNWTIAGTVYEGDSQSGSAVKVANLNDICAGGGGQWVMAGAVMSFDWQRPRVSLATITDNDLIDGGGEVVGLQSARNRFNSVFPRYRSAAHNWEIVTAEKITGSTYLAEDGRDKPQTREFSLVKNPVQAGQLATYAMTDSREIGPITLNLGVQWRFYRPGDTLRYESGISGFVGNMVIISRQLNNDRLGVTLRCRGETSAKHAYALGQVAVPPPTPIVGQTPEERDNIVSSQLNPRGALTLLSTNPLYPIVGGNAQIAITAFSGMTSDGRAISFPAQAITGLNTLSTYSIFWDIITEAYDVELFPATIYESDRNKIRLGSARTSDGVNFEPMPEQPPGYYPTR